MHQIIIHPVNRQRFQSTFISVSFFLCFFFASEPFQPFQMDVHEMAPRTKYFLAERS